MNLMVRWGARASRLLGSASRRTLVAGPRMVPVGETPTGAAGTAALPIQTTTVQGEPPFVWRMPWDHEPNGVGGDAPASWSAPALRRFLPGAGKAAEGCRTPKPGGIVLPLSRISARPVDEGFKESRLSLGLCIGTMNPSNGGARLRRALEFRSANRSGFDRVSPHRVQRRQQGRASRASLPLRRFSVGDGNRRIELDFFSGQRCKGGSMRRKTGQIKLSTVSGLAAILLWSTTIAVARRLSEQLGPVTAAASVYWIGGLLCLVHSWWTGAALDRFLKLPRSYVLGCGFLFLLYTVALYLAVGLAQGREQALEIGLINYLWPAGTVLLSVPLLRKRASLLLWPGTALALAGVFLVMTQGSRVSWHSFLSHFATNPWAYGLAFVAASSWAFYSTLTRRWSDSGQDGAVDLFIAITGVVLLGMRCFVDEATVWNVQAVAESTFLGGMTALAYALWDYAMREGDVLLVAICSYFTPLLSMLVSCAYLNVTPHSTLWVGCALLMAGSFVSWRSVSEPAPRAVDRSR